LTGGLFWLKNRSRVREQRRCGRSRQIARAAAACAGAGKRRSDGESGAEEGARVGNDRAGADPRRPTPVCEDSASARSPLGAAEDRLGPGRAYPCPVWDRSLEDPCRPERAATGRADQLLPRLNGRRRGRWQVARASAAKAPVGKRWKKWRVTPAPLSPVSGTATRCPVGSVSTGARGSVSERPSHFCRRGDFAHPRTRP
jgi:hypothetical protein